MCGGQGMMNPYPYLSVLGTKEADFDFEFDFTQLLSVYKHIPNAMW